MLINFRNQTFIVELDSMERMLIQMELTVMAGDHESYKISTQNNKTALISEVQMQNVTNLDLRTKLG